MNRRKLLWNLELRKGGKESAFSCFPEFQIHKFFALPVLNTFEKWLATHAALFAGNAGVLPLEPDAAMEARLRVAKGSDLPWRRG